MRFLKLGATAYGGPAMIGQIKETVVKKYGWMKEGEFLQGVALCQLIPGATMVQIATYVGYRLRGIRGAIISAVAFVFPAFIVLLILSTLYFKLQNLWFIEALFKGLGTAVVAIVLNACINLGRSILKDWKVVLISILSFFGFLFRLNVLLIFIFAALAALLLYSKGGKGEHPLRPSRFGGLKSTTEVREDYIILGVAAFLICIGLVFSYSFNPQLTYLSLTLSKIGALAFGGGFTMIPLIQYEVVERFRWLSTKEFLDGIALGQVTPGPIMITATFIGYKLSGLLGALMATIGIFFPSFFILILFIPYYDRLRGIKIVQTIERGILGSFIGMLGLVLHNFGRTALVDIPSIIFAGAAFFALLKKIDLPYILLAGGILSLLVFGLLL